MSFPLKYIGEVTINKPDNFDFELYSTQVYKLLSREKEPFVEGIHFSHPLPWIGLKLRYSLHLIDEHATVHAKYVISLFELNIIFLLFGGLSVFFGFANHTGLLIFSAIVAVGYYWLGLNSVSQSLKGIIFQKMTDSHFMEEPGLWKKQQQWLKMERLCSACGEEINPYSDLCTSCGIRTANKKNLVHGNINPTNNDSNISYSYKKSD